MIDADVVQEMVWQRYNGLQPVVGDDLLMDFTLARAEIAGQQGGAVEHNGNAATLALGFISTSNGGLETM